MAEMIPIAICCTIGLLAVLRFIYCLSRPRCDEGHHTFEARYSEESTPPQVDTQFAFMVSTSSIEALTGHKDTYIHDICIHCGKIVKAEKPGFVAGHYADTVTTSHGSTK